MMRTALLLLLFAGAAFAHGGVYRPPPRGNPFDPTPTPGRPGGGPTTAGAPKSQAAPTRWETWWGYNRERYLRIRERLQQRTVRSGTDAPNPTGELFDREGLRQTILTPLMIEALGHEEEEIRTAAAVALGKFRAKAAIEPLKKRFTDDRIRQVREAALVGLLLMRDASLRDWFRGVVESPKETRRVRGMAVMALGFLGDSAYLESILKGKVKIDMRADLREIHSTAALALGFTQSPFSGSTLHKVTKQYEPSDAARAFAPVSLARLDYLPAVPTLLGLVKDRRADAGVRYGAAIAAGTLIPQADVETIELLGKKAQKDHDRTLRGFLAISLGRIGGDEAAKHLVAGLKYAQPSERGFFYIALGLTRSEEAGSLLLDEFKKIKNNSDRGACAIGIGLSGYRKAAPTLRKRVQEKVNMDFTPHCMLALGLLDDRESIPVIQELLKEYKDPALRSEGAVALALLRRTAAIPELIELLRTSKSLRSRGAIVQALGLVGTDKAVDPLLEIYKDTKRPEVERAMALAALGRIGDPDAIPLLATMTFDLNYYVGSEAVNELATIL